uniref:integrase n=1 Tax=Streptomyces rugosispiralis TaxID=2967341 RepID=UPI003704CA1C
MIKRLLEDAHIGVAVGVYTRVRLRLQRQAIGALGRAFSPTDNDPDDPDIPPAAAVFR